jgi:hypothetical protein
MLGAKDIFFFNVKTFFITRTTPENIHPKELQSWDPNTQTREKKVITDVHRQNLTESEGSATRGK